MTKFTYFTGNETPRYFQLIKLLRPHLTLETFLSLITEAKVSGGYKLIGLEIDEKLVGVMGYRILCDFVHGRHVYIDDLVTAEEVRSKGYGAMLLRKAEDIAKETGCTNLRLCTGIDNERGKKFYENNSWMMRAVVFKKKL